MRSVPRLLVAFWVALSGWLVTLAIARARNRKCNPDDLTECDTPGDVLLGVALLTPALLLLLIWMLCISTLVLLRDMPAKTWVRQPPVLAVIGTLAALGTVLGPAVFGELEGLL